MRLAHYMIFKEGHSGALDRIGGLPTHVPPDVPAYPETGKPRAFLAQFYCCPGRLEIEGAMCLHLYQDPDEDEPSPLLVIVPSDAPVNTSNVGVKNERIGQYDINWKRKEDPDEVTEDDVDLTDSKAGGTCYFWDCVREGESLVLQIGQRPAGFNFGGYTVVIVRTKEGKLVIRLG